MGVYKMIKLVQLYSSFIRAVTCLSPSHMDLLLYLLVLVVSFSAICLALDVVINFYNMSEYVIFLIDSQSTALIIY